MFQQLIRETVTLFCCSIVPVSVLRCVQWETCYKKNNSPETLISSKLSFHDTQSSFDLLHNQLLVLHNKHFPKVRKKIRYNNKKPWLSEGLRNSIKHKNNLCYKYKGLDCVRNEIQYKTYKTKLRNVLRSAEKLHYQNLLLKYSNYKKILVSDQTDHK